jgi:hypothetical protein
MKTTFFPIAVCWVGLISSGCVTRQPLPAGLHPEIHLAGGVKIQL